MCFGVKEIESHNYRLMYDRNRTTTNATGSLITAIINNPFEISGTEFMVVIHSDWSMVCSTRGY